MKTFKEKLPGWIIVTLLLNGLCHTASAQDYAAAKSTSALATTRFSIDTAFVGKNMRDNKMEIDLSELALKRSTNQDVRKAAQQMVTDHTQILNDLAKIAQNNNMLAIAGYPTNGTAGGTGTQSNSASGVDNGMSSESNVNKSNSGNINSNANKSNASGNKSIGTTGSTNTGSYNSLGTNGITTSRPNRNTNGTNANTGTPNSNDANAGRQMTMQGNGNDMHMQMQDMTALQSVSGAAFDKLWIPQMLSMHEAKLSELTSAVDAINDSDLKTAVNAAIPKIKMHRNLLSSINNSSAAKR